MIKTLEVRNSYGEKLIMDLRNPEKSGYIISGITGLGPVDVDIKQTQMVSGLKYKYSKGFHKFRDINISFIFDEWNISGTNNSRETIEELRFKLMDYLKTNDLITLYFIKDNGAIRKIEGYVSKHDPTYFSNSCGAQVTVTCPDPWFRKVTRIGTEEKDYDTITINSAYVEEDGMYVYSSNDINYEGSIPSGFEVEFQNDVSDTLGCKINISSWHYALQDTGLLYMNEPSNYIPVFSERSRYRKSLEKKDSITNGVEVYHDTSSTNHLYLFTKNDDNYLYLSISDIALLPAYGLGYDVILYNPTNSEQTGSLGKGRFKVNILDDGRMTYATEDWGSLQGGYVNYIRVIINNSYSYIGVSSNFVGDSLDSHLVVDTSTDYLSTVVRPFEGSGEDNVLGWVDSSTISKRQNLPALNGGRNKIKIKTSKPINSNPIAKIYYHTLYRGL